MAEVVCSRVPIKPGSLRAVRDWARAINARRGEALDSLRAESVAIESVFLEHASDGDFLIYYVRAENMAQAHEVSGASSRDIDRYHFEFLRTHTERPTSLELLVDLEACDAI